MRFWWTTPTLYLVLVLVLRKRGRAQRHDCPIGIVWNTAIFSFLFFFFLLLFLFLWLGSAETGGERSQGGYKCFSLDVSPVGSRMNLTGSLVTFRRCDTALIHASRQWKLSDARGEGGMQDQHHIRPS